MGSTKRRLLNNHVQIILTVFVFACGVLSAPLRAMMSVDLGGEFIKIAVVRAGIGMEIVLNEESSRKTRAIVAFQDGERHFASQAENIALRHPGRAVGYLTDILGCHFDDPKVQLYRKRFPYYNLLKDEERGTVLFKIDENTIYSPEEILAMLLEEAKKYAESFARQDIKDAILTVPPFYNQAERRAVQTAAQLAGINLLHLMSDNAAVALNYGVFRQKNFNSSTQFYMFYDMGASSTTATIVGYKVKKTRTEEDVVLTPQLTVVGVGFDRTLGGLEFTLKLRAHLARAFNTQGKTALKVEESEKSMAKLWKEAERVKKVLSANMNHQAQVENLLDSQDFRVAVTRAEFEQMTEDLFERVTRPIDAALSAAHLTLPKITDIILMGGGTRMPKVQEILMKHLGRSELGKSINTDEAAALGAVYKAASFSIAFRVMNFVVSEGNIFPISVVYERQKAKDEVKAKSVLMRHVLYEQMCPYPQKKVVTFTSNFTDFTFNVTYSNLQFLSVSDRRSFRNSVISKYTLTVDKDALSKILDKAEVTGIKAHFYMNESGILVLDRVEAFATDVNGATDSDVQTELTVEEEIEEEDTLTYEDKENKKDETADGKTDSAPGGADKPALKDVVSEKFDVPALKDVVSEKFDVPALKDVVSEKHDMPVLKDDVSEKHDMPVLKDDVSEKVGMPVPKDDVSEKVDIRGLKKPQKSKIVYSKVVSSSEFITIKQDHLDLKDMSKEKVEAAKQRLADQRRADQEKVVLQKAKNDLESFILGYKDKLRQGPYIECSTETERTHLLKLIDLNSQWLYEQSNNINTSDFTYRLQVLKDNSKNVTMRVHEMDKRPKALKILNTLLEPNVLESIRNLSITDPAMISKAEVTYFEQVLDRTKQWRDKQIKIQQKLKPYENPVLLTEHIAKKYKVLEKEFKSITNKLKRRSQPVENTVSTLGADDSASEVTNKTESDKPSTVERMKLEL